MSRLRHWGSAVLMRFLLPVLGLGAMMIALEAGLHALGFEGNHANLLRYAVLGLYAAMALRGFGGGASSGGEA